MAKINPEIIKKDFPVFRQDIEGKRLIYLDNGATTQKPLQVIEAMAEYNRLSHGNPHRGAHKLSIEATKAYDSAKEKIKEFINAKSTEEIVFTRNTTESLNLIAYSYGKKFISEGNEIVLTISEHHSNILPWQRVVKENKGVLKYMYLNDEGRLTLDEIKNKITNKTKLVSIGYMSNVLGTIHPIEEIIDYAHKMGAVVVIDGAQSAPHLKIDVQKLDADFFVFSAHKMLGPMGIGVLYGKKEILESMPPFLMGGDMIEYVYKQEATFAPLPYKFEAGTQNVEGAVGLKAAIEYLEKVGLNNIEEHEKMLTEYALNKMLKLPYIDIQGPKDLEMRGGLISFTVDGVHPHDVSTILDSYGIAIRAGHHCAQPLMRFLDVPATSRISFYLYNTKDDIDQFIEGVKNVRKWFGYGS
ncbi:cysteine desulfurase [Tepidimicrobium xylanilyticum]|uniref:cysteine desulfurase n=1 Tax=Tepidimicrobium xylanilyticum TaxID=1123352 RepID=A0A1H2ZYG0_9FIRM|nr:cysteine desulfurase [Tepidimicrobium xylanilyticum]GMG96381.1 cysteine desulfurase [Tepidimicrobium xylanilyticum]SDX21964.1 cysteine desulfurase [Tepidimicrobium xylanilyticum]